MMPYRLQNAAQTFQRFMDQVCWELSFVFIYMGNILVASHTPEKHVHHLQILFTHLSQYGLVINQTSANLVSPPSTFSATALALQALPLWKIVWKLSAIFLLPQARLPCKSTWDSSTFTITFIRTVQKSSTRCTSSSKKRTFLGSGQPHVRPHSSNAKRHYRYILFWHTPILQHLRQSPLMPPKLLLVLCSNNFMANGPRYLFSCKLCNPDTRYSDFDRELLATYLAIRHLRHFVEGRPFTIFTDHKPLTFALSSANSDKWTPR